MVVRSLLDIDLKELLRLIEERTGVVLVFVIVRNAYYRWW